MKTDDNKLKQDTQPAAMDTAKVSKEKAQYRAVNRESGKEAGIPTSDKEMGPRNAARKKLYPDSNVETGEHHPGLGV